MKTLQLATLALGLGMTLSAQAPDFTPATPLIGALLKNDTTTAKRLLAGGANPNEGQFLIFPPVFLPVIRPNLELLRMMVAYGADPRVTDKSGSTTLMWAAFNENGDTALVDELLKMGVNPNAQNLKGETALNWAMQRGYTPVVAKLEKAGASDITMLKGAVERAIALLQKSGPEFVKVSGCSSCHNQSLPQIAINEARSRGLVVDEQISQKQVKAVIAMFKPMHDIMMEGTDKFPDPPISVSYSLLGLAAEHYHRDSTTDAMAHLIATKQLPDGSFRAIAARPPLESSDISATALSLRALQIYGEQDAETRVAAAREWLRGAQARTSEDRAMRLMGMAWGNAPSDAIATAAQEVIAHQNPDGGWSQLPGLESDAYATGQAMAALKWAGQVEISDAAWRRGVTFLLRTQLTDGSWLVHSRTFPFQPYKESGFPHGKDQWISAAGTSWAAAVLSMSMPETPVVSASLASGN